MCISSFQLHCFFFFLFSTSCPSLLQFSCPRTFSLKKNLRIKQYFKISQSLLFLVVAFFFFIIPSFRHFLFSVFFFISYVLVHLLLVCSCLLIFFHFYISFFSLSFASCKFSFIFPFSTLSVCHFLPVCFLSSFPPPPPPLAFFTSYPHTHPSIHRVNPPPHTHPLPPPRLGQQTSTQTSPISVTTGRRSFEVALSSSNKQSVIPTVRLTAPPAPPATRHPEHLPSSDANSCFPTS